MQRFLQIIQLLAEQGTRARQGGRAHYTFGGSLGAMRCTEGIHYKYVTQGRHGGRQRFIVAFLSTIKAYVLAQNNFTGLNGHAIKPVSFQPDFHAQQLLQARCHRPERELCIELTFNRPPQVRQQKN